eukprot:gene24823-biopygen5963
MVATCGIFMVGAYDGAVDGADGEGASLGPPVGVAVLQSPVLEAGAQISVYQHTPQQKHG